MKNKSVNTVFYQYLLLWVLFMMNGSILQSIYPLIMNILSVLLIVYSFVKYKGLINQSLFIYSLICIIVVVLGELINGGLGLSILINLLIGLLLPYISYKVDEVNFYHRFIYVVLFYCIISNISTVLYWFSPNKWTSIFPSIHVQGFNFSERVSFVGNPFFHTIGIAKEGYYTDKTFRNLGVFYEPGLYQIILNSALYILMFYNDKKLKIKNRWTCIVIVLFTIIMAQSTIGFISSMTILVFYMLSEKKLTKNKRNILIVMSVLVGTLLIDYLYRGQESIIFKVIIYKVFGYGNQISFSNTSRIIMIKYAFEQMLKTPFGVGYDLFFKNAPMYASGGFLISSFAIYGIIQTVLLLYYGLRFAFINKTKIQTIVLLIMFINVGLAQSRLFYPGLMVLFFLPKNDCECINVINEE